MFAYPELAKNIGEGEPSVAAVLSYDGTDYDVTGQFSHRWKRKEVDGQLTTDLPLETITFTMPAGQVPDIERKYWPLFKFHIDGKEYGVRYATGSNPVTFYLVIPTEVIEEEKEQVEEDDIEGEGGDTGRSSGGSDDGDDDDIFGGIV